MSWTGAALPVLAALAVVLVPGLALAVAARLRGVAALALAGPLGFLVIGVAGVAAAAVHVPFGWLAVAVVAAVAVAVVAGVRALLAGAGRPLPAWDTWRPASWLPALAAAAVSSAVVAGIAFAAVASPDRFSQTYDAVFHLNAIASIVQGGDASSLHLYRITHPTKDIAFYPAVFHSIAALTVQLTGAPITVAANATWIATAGPVFSLGCALSSAALFGATGLRRATEGRLQRPLIAATGALLASVFVAFPYLLLDFGTLYPNGLAYTTLPVGLALIATVLRFPAAAPWRPEAPGPLGRQVALTAAWFTAAAFTHPRSVVAIAVLALPLAVAWFAARMRALAASGERGRRRARIGWALLAAGFAALLVVGYVGIYHYYDLAHRPIADHLNGGPAQASESVPQALLQGLTVTSLVSPTNATLPPSVLLAAVVFAGLIATLIRPGLRWAVVTYVAVVLLYAAAAGSNSDIAKLATGLWDKDKFRILAMLPTIGVPLAAWTIAAGAAEVAEAARTRRRRRADARPITVALVGGGAALVVAIVAWTGPALGGVSTAIGQVFALPDSSKQGALVDADEQALLEDVGRFVPRGQLIVGNPWNGSALAWALGGRQTLFPHLGGSFGTERNLLKRHLDDWQTDPAVCRAVRDLDVHWVIVDVGWLRGDHKAAEAFHPIDLVANTPGVRLVASSGSARLYRLTACWPASP